MVNHSRNGEYSSEQVITVRRTRRDGRKSEGEEEGGKRSEEKRREEKRREKRRGEERRGEQPQLIAVRDAHLHFKSRALAKISTRHSGRPVRASTRPRFNSRELERRSHVYNRIQ